MTNQSEAYQNGKKADQDLWGRAVSLASAPVTQEISSIGNANALAILFEPGLTLDLRGSNALCGTQMVSLRVPIHVADTQQLIGYFQRLTFAIRKSPGAKVLIFVDLAGTAKSWEFDYQPPGSETVDLLLKDEVVFSAQGLERSGDMGVGLFGPVADYHATLLITAQRRSEQEFVIASIENLDVSAHLASREL